MWPSVNKGDYHSREKEVALSGADPADGCKGKRALLILSSHKGFNNKFRDPFCCEIYKHCLVLDQKLHVFLWSPSSLWLGTHSPFQILCVSTLEQWQLSCRNSIQLNTLCLIYNFKWKHLLKEDSSRNLIFSSQFQVREEKGREPQDYSISHHSVEQSIVEPLKLPT